MTAQNLTSCWCTAAKIQEFAEEALGSIRFSFRVANIWRGGRYDSPPLGCCFEEGPPESHMAFTSSVARQRTWSPGVLVAPGCWKVVLGILCMLRHVAAFVWASGKLLPE